MRKMMVRMGATILPAALAVTACASSSSSGTSTNGAPQGPKDLKIGLLVPLTGALGSWGADWRRAYQMAADEINKAHVLPNGGQVKFVVQDEQGDPEAAITAATKMIQIDKVSAIVGPTSDTIVALDQLATSNKVPIVSPAAGTVRLDTLGGQWLWRTYPSDSAEGAAVATYLRQDKHLSKAALLTENQESPQGIAKVFQSTFKSDGGTVTKQVTINSGQSSYDAEVQSALATHPDTVYMTGSEQAGRTLVQELSQANFHGQLAINGDLTSPGFMKSVGPSLLEGACSGEASPDVKLPEYVKFATAWTQRYHTKPYVTISNAYDSLIIIGLAALAAHSTSGAAIQSKLVAVTNPPGTAVHSFAEGAAALAKGDDINYEGASGPLDFDAHGTSPEPFTVACVKAGKWVPMKTFQPS